VFKLPSYEYKKLHEDWDLFLIDMKLSKVLSVKPKYLSGYQTTSPEGESEGRVVLTFDKPLTEEDKAKLDEAMSDPEIGLYPKSMEGYTVLVINDLYDAWEFLETECQFPIKYIFPCVPFHDVIEVWVEGKLTPKQIGDFKEAYLKLFKGKKT